MINKLKMLSVVILTTLTVSANAGLVMSNTNSFAGRLSPYKEINVGAWYATPITTDGNDYSLTSVIANISDWNPAGTLVMEIWSVNLGMPDMALERLTLSGDPASGPKTFTGNLSLTADTSYFIVTGVDNGGGQWIEYINTDNAEPFGPDFNTDSGSSWALNTMVGSTPEYTSYSSSTFGSSWSSDGTGSAPLRMEIHAIAVPEPTVISLIGLGACAVMITRRIKK